MAGKKDFKILIRYTKPFQKDYRRPENAEELLKNVDDINTDDIVGFLDEMAVEASTNTARLWSFGKTVKVAT